MPWKTSEPPNPPLLEPPPLGERNKGEDLSIKNYCQAQMMEDFLRRYSQQSFEDWIKIFAPRFHDLWDSDAFRREVYDKVEDPDFIHTLQVSFEEAEREEHERTGEDVHPDHPWQGIPFDKR